MQKCEIIGYLVGIWQGKQVIICYWYLAGKMYIVHPHNNHDQVSFVNQKQVYPTPLVWSERGCRPLS